MIFILFIISLLLPTRNHAMEAPGSDTKESVTVYVANDVPLSIPSKTATWLKENSSTIRNMMEDCDVKGSQDIYLPTISDAQFNALTAFIDAHQKRSFKELCKRPIVKKLVDLLYVAENLDIKPLQDAITDEVAYRYSAYPSLARRHSNLSAIPEKYRPRFLNSHVETVIAQKIVSRLAFSGPIKCLKVISKDSGNAYITHDKKQIISIEKSKDVLIWDSSSGKLYRTCAYKSLDDDSGNMPNWIRPMINVNGAYILTSHGENGLFIRNSKASILQKAYSDFSRFKPTKTELIPFVTMTPDNKTIIATTLELHDNKLVILKEDKQIWDTKYFKFNRAPLDKIDGKHCYAVAFADYPYMTKNGKYLFFKYRLGVKKLNLETYEEKYFDFIPLSNYDDEVSALTVTPDESHILVGICEATCKTMIKVLKSDTGELIKTIDINTKAYCESPGSYNGWPYDYISAITMTPDGTKIIVASKKEKTKIIDFATGGLIQEVDTKTNFTETYGPFLNLNSFLAVNANGTRIIAGYRPLAIYGNPAVDDAIVDCLQEPTPLENMLKVLGEKKDTNCSLIRYSFSFFRISLYYLRKMAF